VKGSLYRLLELNLIQGSSFLFNNNYRLNYIINNMFAKTGYKKLMSLAIEATNKGYIRFEDEDEN